MESKTMKYMLLMYWNQNESTAPPTPEGQQAAQQEWFALMKEMEAAGVLVSNNGLAPVTDATSVRVRNGKSVISDGPFAETHEQLGGFFLLECKDLDEAIHWAEKIPSAREGTIEIRPQWNQK
jgi:hypothetical protein